MPIKKQVADFFGEQGWGLYLVLGLVTAILVVVIIRVFPEEEAPPESPSDEEEKEP